MPQVGQGPVRVALLAEPLLGNLIGLVLRHVDARCRSVSSQADLGRLVKEWDPEILVADVDRWEEAPLWSADGTGRAVPCLGLMRRRETVAKLEAFQRGVADLIAVPFTPDEIVVRAVAAMARAGGRRVSVLPRVRVGRFELDVLGPAVRLGGTAVRLTLLEQTLLYLFLANPGEVLGRDVILATIWGSQSAVTSNVIDRHIRDLRVKLQERWREPRFIATEPGKGYRFVGDGAP